jgi:plastocyanin
MIRKSLIPTLALVLLVLAAGAAHAGTLTGKVNVAGAKNNANAVVYVEGVGSSPAAAKEAVMDQEGMSFVPHVLPVQVGTTVEFLNSDQVSHNVFTPDKCAGQFNLGTWGKGQKRTYTFDKPCTAVILCAIHPEMEGYVVAVPTPYFAVTGADGSFTIKGVPEGTHTVKVWHPGGKESSLQVNVTGDTQVDLKAGR